MSIGVATQSSGRVINMYSPNMTASFYRGNTMLTNSGVIQDSAWSGTFAISTPISPASIYSDVQYRTSVSCVGHIPSGGLSYSQAQFINTSDSSPDKIGGGSLSPSITPNPAYIHYFGTPIFRGNSYGLVAPGSNGSSISIDNQYKSLYIQPSVSDGSVIRSGSAVSLPSSYWPSKDPAASSFTQPTPQNIYFDKGYTNPPLIFITLSSGPIAMNYMIRDGGGKYIGASIVACSNLVALDNNRGVGFYTSNTFSFSYFLISEEPPSYSIAPEGWGMRVFDSDGGEIFSSSYFVPTLLIGNSPITYSALHSNSYYTFNSSGFVISGPLGVCINNFNSVTGFSGYNAYNVSTGYSLWQFGPMNITGKYLHLDGSRASLYGLGSLSIARATTSGIFPGRTLSAEFSGDTSGQMDVLFANYSY